MGEDDTKDEIEDDSVPMDELLNGGETGLKAYDAGLKTFSAPHFTTALRPMRELKDDPLFLDEGSGKFLDNFVKSLRYGLQQIPSGYGMDPHNTFRFSFLSDSSSFTDFHANMDDGMLNSLIYFKGHLRGCECCDDFSYFVEVGYLGGAHLLEKPDNDQPEDEEVREDLDNAVRKFLKGKGFDKFEFRAVYSTLSGEDTASLFEMAVLQYKAEKEKPPESQPAESGDSS